MGSIDSIMFIWLIYKRLEILSQIIYYIRNRIHLNPVTNPQQLNPDGSSTTNLVASTLPPPRTRQKVTQN